LSARIPSPTSPQASSVQEGSYILSVFSFEM